MKFLIIIPAHNEENNLPFTLDSLKGQIHDDFKVVVVNDGSTDATAEVIKKYVEADSRFETINLQKSAHQPGSKVVAAFKKGLETQNIQAFDIICKFDSDIILTENYLQKIAESFQRNPDFGLVGGLLYVEKNGEWVYEGHSNKNHVRGVNENGDRGGAVRPADIQAKKRRSGYLYPHRYCHVLSGVH